MTLELNSPNRLVGRKPVGEIPQGFLKCRDVLTLDLHNLVLQLFQFALADQDPITLLASEKELGQFVRFREDASLEVYFLSSQNREFCCFGSMPKLDGAIRLNRLLPERLFVCVLTVEERTNVEQVRLRIIEGYWSGPLF